MEGKSDVVREGGKGKVTQDPGDHGEDHVF